MSELLKNDSERLLVEPEMEKKNAVISHLEKQVRLRMDLMGAKDLKSRLEVFDKALRQ
jgi:hypothetical protein